MYRTDPILCGSPVLLAIPTSTHTHTNTRFSDCLFCYLCQTSFIVSFSVKSFFFLCGILRIRMVFLNWCFCLTLQDQLPAHGSGLYHAHKCATHHTTHPQQEDTYHLAAIVYIIVEKGTCTSPSMFALVHVHEIKKLQTHQRKAHTLLSSVFLQKINRFL